MGKSITLGGERLKSGKRNTVKLRSYERSTHDLTEILRTSMSAGTVVPFSVNVGLPGDTFEYKLNSDIKTLPTVGPLFGHFEYNQGIFMVPIRLFNRQMQVNETGIGLKINTVKLPQMELRGVNPTERRGDLDNQQVNPSSIMSYLNIRGLGYSENTLLGNIGREFNAVSWLSYWEIIKNYFANKQEKVGYVIHNPLNQLGIGNYFGQIKSGAFTYNLQHTDPNDNDTVIDIIRDDSYFELTWTDETEEFSPERVTITINDQPKTGYEMWETWTFNQASKRYRATGFRYGEGNVVRARFGYFVVDQTIEDVKNAEPDLVEFDLSNIDEMRTKIMSHTGTEAFMVTEQDLAPYNLITNSDADAVNGLVFSLQSNQEGLAVACYKSDLFNNWLDTEWIDGENGVNDLTKVTVDENGSFKLNQLNLMKKMFDMLNGIVMSGGSFDDWQEAVYDHSRMKQVTSPVYLGGCSRNIEFQEVIANTVAENQPLGQLGGRGTTTSQEGGNVRVSVDEHCYIIGLQWITPIIDYSQGNKWDNNLKTLDDFHKPALDQIGYQELVTDQMAWWDTRIDDIGGIEMRSAGKQPSWMNYMTNVNQTKGNFAEANDQMFMTLNRRYEPAYNDAGGVKEIFIKDLTTYIDPKKYNHVFAEARRDSQNFWVQTGTKIEARRKMSAKQIPMV